MNDEKWIDPQLLNRVSKMQYLLLKIKNADTLTPENWDEIITYADEVESDAEELLDFAIDRHTRMIGD